MAVIFAGIFVLFYFRRNKLLFPQQEDAFVVRLPKFMLYVGLVCSLVFAVGLIYFISDIENSVESIGGIVILAAFMLIFASMALAARNWRIYPYADEMHYTTMLGNTYVISYKDIARVTVTKENVWIKTDKHLFLAEGNYVQGMSMLLAVLDLAGVEIRNKVAGKAAAPLREKIGQAEALGFRICRQPSAWMQVMRYGNYQMAVTLSDGLFIEFLSRSYEYAPD